MKRLPPVLPFSRSIQRILVRSFLLLLVISPMQVSMGQIDSSKLEFYPLHIGDIWQYNNGPSIVKILGDTVINGKRYFISANPDFPQNAAFVRIDSLYREAWYTPVADDCVLPSCDCIRRNDFEQGTYRLNEPLGSVYEVCEDRAGVVCTNPKYIMKYVAFVEDAVGPGMDAMIFNPQAVDTVTGDTCKYEFRFILVRGLGVYREEYEADRFMQLTGAIINGVQWGTIVSVEEPKIPSREQFQLEQNFPNPFNARTTIRFSLPVRSTITLKLYDVLGREVRTLAEGDHEPQTYSISFDLSGLSSGVYFYRLQAQDFVVSKKLILSR